MSLGNEMPNKSLSETVYKTISHQPTFSPHTVITSNTGTNSINFSIGPGSLFFRIYEQP
jgi:hypothetical protein